MCYEENKFLFAYVLHTCLLKPNGMYKINEPKWYEFKSAGEFERYYLKFDI